MPRLVKTYLVGLFVVFLHMSGLFRTMQDPYNRFCYLWQTQDGIALLADLFLIALCVTGVAYGLERLVRRWGRPALVKVLQHVFLLALWSGLAAALSFAIPQKPMRALWLVSMGVIGFSLGHPRSKLVRHAFHFCLIFCALPLLLSLQVLSWGDWSGPSRGAFATRSATAGEAPVFWFVFDEWSYPRSTADGRFRPFFKNVRSLCEQSIVFREARSPSDATEVSIPQLIFQTDSDVSWQDNQMRFTDDGNDTVSTEMPSLFTISREYGYNSYLVGWFAPYAGMLGHNVDYCRTYPVIPKGNSIPARMVMIVDKSMGYFGDPFTQWLWRMRASARMTQHHIWLNRTLREEMLGILEKCPSNSFALFHLDIPHGPFIWNEDGTFRSPWDGRHVDPEGYMRTLRYLDSYIGEIIGFLQSAGRFDDSLLIFTSDHSWRNDPEADIGAGQDWRRRVPLIIKLPGQEAPCVIEEEFCANRLQPLMEAVFAGERDTGRLIELVRELTAAQPARQGESASAP